MRARRKRQNGTNDKARERQGYHGGPGPHLVFLYGVGGEGPRQGRVKGRRAPEQRRRDELLVRRQVGPDHLMDRAHHTREHKEGSDRKQAGREMRGEETGGGERVGWASIGRVVKAVAPDAPSRGTWRRNRPCPSPAAIPSELCPSPRTEPKTPFPRPAAAQPSRGRPPLRASTSRRISSRARRATAGPLSPFRTS
jgi:hypothetical protein